MDDYDKGESWIIRTVILTNVLGILSFRKKNL